MRTRERERFIRLNFTPEELEIRDRLYTNRKLARYKIIITEEHYDKKRKHSNEKPPYDSYLSYFTDHPEDGTYLDTIYFYEPSHLMDILKLYEGMFYQLFSVKENKLIGKGSLDPDSPVEEIREYEGADNCCQVCEDCFWRGMIFGEAKTAGDGKYVICYNPKEADSWKESLDLLERK